MMSDGFDVLLQQEPIVIDADLQNTVGGIAARFHVAKVPVRSNCNLTKNEVVIHNQVFLFYTNDSAKRERELWTGYQMRNC